MERLTVGVLLLIAVWGRWPGCYAMDENISCITATFPVVLLSGLVEITMSFASTTYM